MTRKKVKNLLKDVKKEDMIPVKQKKHRVKKGFYIGYYSRIVLYSFLFLVITVLSFFLFNKTLNIQEAEKISYSEKCNIDYSVKVKENDFYDNEYLDKNMSYIANLIDEISIDYNYKFNSDKKLTGEYEYKVIGSLEILNSGSREIFYRKDYELSETEKKQLKNKNDFNINKKINVDYNKYNNIAKDFITQYGVSTESNLKISLVVNRNINDDLVKNNELDSSTKLLVTIPLSEKAISIKLDYKDIDKNNTVISSKIFKFKNTNLIIISVVCLLISLCILIKIIKLLTVSSVKDVKYDRYVKKLLREYDRLIVNSENMPNLNNFEVTYVKSFGELLDAKDNLLKPICFFEVTPHAKCHFYVKSDKELYIYTIKEVDLTN